MEPLDVANRVTAGATGPFRAAGARSVVPSCICEAPSACCPAAGTSVLNRRPVEKLSEGRPAATGARAEEGPRFSARLLVSGLFSGLYLFRQASVKSPRQEAAEVDPAAPSWCKFHSCLGYSLSLGCMMGKPADAVFKLFL